MNEYLITILKHRLAGLRAGEEEARRQYESGDDDKWYAQIFRQQGAIAESKWLLKKLETAKKESGRIFEEVKKCAI